jgi:copper transport protein
VSRKAKENFIRQILLTGFVLLLLIMGGTRRAQAHAELVRSEPADNSVLDKPPEQIRLWFSEAVVPQFSSVKILDVEGNLIPTVSIQGDPGDPTFLQVELPVLAQGIYSVSWNVISGSDGHLSRGYIVFSVGESSAGANFPQTSKKISLLLATILDVTLLWLNYLTQIILTGSLGILLFVLNTRLRDDAPESEREPVNQKARMRIFRLGWIGAGLAMGIGLVQLVLQANSLASTASESASWMQVTGQILTNTSWGHALIAREVLLAILFWLFYRYQKQKHSSWYAYAGGMAAAVGMLVAQSLVSHAAGEENAFLPVAINMLHMLFVGLWIGGLAALVVGFYPFLRQDRNLWVEVIRPGWAKFSPLAAISVGLVVATGLYSTAQEVISADALLLSPYGKTLSMKYLLVILAGLLGIINSLLLHPGFAVLLAGWLGKPPGWTPVRMSRFPKLVLTESLVGVVIVLTVGILTTFPPARDPKYTIAIGDQTDDVMQAVNDIFVTLSIKPNRPGQNLFSIKVMDSRRPPPAETLRVIVKMTYLERDIGTTTQDAELEEKGGWITTYRLVNSHLTQPGRWSMEIVVRRKGLSDSTVVIPWTVYPLVDLRPTLVSRSPWRKELLVMAGLVALVVLFLTGLVLANQKISGYKKR